MSVEGTLHTYLLSRFLISHKYVSFEVLLKHFSIYFLALKNSGTKILSNKRTERFATLGEKIEDNG